MKMKMGKSHELSDAELMQGHKRCGSCDAEEAGEPKMSKKAEAKEELAEMMAPAAAMPKAAKLGKGKKLGKSSK